MAIPAIGTRRTTLADSTYRYTGVITAGTTTLADCGHQHRNRDQTTRTGGTSARDCITLLLRATVLPALAEQLTTEAANAWQALTRGFGAPADTIARAKAESAKAAAAMLGRITALREALAAHGAVVDPSKYGLSSTRIRAHVTAA